MNAPLNAATYPSQTSQACQVFAAEAVFVAQGVNMGDPLGLPGQVCEGDIYQLDPQARATRLSVARMSGQQQIAAGSHIGAPGDRVEIIALYTLMGDDGDAVELLLIALHGAEAGLFALPLSPMAAGAGYQLLKIEDPPAAGEAALSDMICVSFGRGTLIAMADGSQRPIESLAAGDAVLTRDHGAQPVRWVGHATLRARGAFAPVVIRAGAMGNAGELIVSQHHRMFIYYCKRLGDLTTPELLIQARHLVDGDRICLREGGYVDYFSLVFDRHEIVYAEGIPAESLLVTEAVLNRLPAQIAAPVKDLFPGLTQIQHFGTEAGRQIVDALHPLPWDAARLPRSEPPCPAGARPAGE